MGIVNRTMDASERNYERTVQLGAVATGETRHIYIAPFPVRIKQAKVACLGLSGAPTHALQLTRFVIGAGATTITIAAAVAVPALGTSGLFGLSLPAAGSTLLDLQSGDVLQILTAVANTNMTSCSYALVLEALQDIKSYFSTSYT